MVNQGVATLKVPYWLNLSCLGMDSCFLSSDYQTFVKG